MCAVDAVHRLAASPRGQTPKLSHALSIDPFRCQGYPAGHLGLCDEAGVHSGSEISNVES